MREYVRDRAGRTLGWYEDNGVSGKIAVRDASGRWLASYDQRRDETRDAAGRLVGRGNLLASFLVQPRR